MHTSRGFRFAIVPTSEEQRDDLLRVASRCPVHRTLAAVAEVIDTVETVP